MQRAVRNMLRFAVGAAVFSFNLYATSDVHAQTAAEAARFIADADRQLGDASVLTNRASWMAVNFITVDTEALNADAQTKYSMLVQKLAMEAKRFDNIQLPAEVRRHLNLLKLSLAAPPPGDPAKAAELAALTVGMEAEYGKGSYCRTKAGKKECLQVGDVTRILAESRDPAELLDVWKGWHAIGAPMRDRYSRFVLLSNAGVQELGYANAGAMWRSGYDMPPDDFARELDRLWAQVRPLYESLHAYVRTKLNQQYGDAVVSKTGPIPAHLLGNIWAQDWSNLYDIVAPKTQGTMPDVGALLRAKNIDALGMAHMSEGFFTSMGLQRLPETFWERSLITKPRDREVVCHASAWDIDNIDDVRIKMCTEVNAEDFQTLHHEMGHDYYYLAYKHLPFLYKNGANDGFHEAIGDALALSITPEYLKTVGLLDKVPSAAMDTALLLQQALSKVAFLPFGLLVDQWRWKVFSGEVTPANYNAAWWDLRRKYQGLAMPSPRSEADFDPAAKYHVAANVPYSRYFLAAILQFQFYKAMCREAGYTGPLNRCSFYGSREAGTKLSRMLQLGQSKPWPDALYELTGSREMDAGALMEYFAPLKVWLDQQNKGVKTGW